MKTLKLSLLLLFPMIFAGCSSLQKAPQIPEVYLSPCQTPEVSQMEILEDLVLDLYNTRHMLRLCAAKHEALATFSRNLK